MHRVQVDLVSAEPAQRRAQRTVEVALRGSDLVDIGAGSEPGLGGQRNPAGHVGGPAGKPAPEQFLGRPGAIDVGGVDEVPVGLDEPVEDRNASGSSVSVRKPIVPRAMFETLMPVPGRVR